MTISKMDEKNPTELTDIIIDDVFNFNINPVDNMINLLTNRQTSIQISCNCHEFLRDRFKWFWSVTMIMGILSSGAALVISSVSSSCDDSLNIPMVSCNAFVFVLTGFIAKENYKDQSSAHDKCYVQAKQLVQDIDYVLHKPHTLDEITQTVDVFEEKIKAFGDSQEPIPFWVKRKFIL